MQTEGKHFYRAMLRRARLCHSMSSVRLWRSTVQVPWSHRLEYFLKVYAWDDANIGDLVDRWFSAVCRQRRL